MARVIELTRGYRAVVDDGDFDDLSQWKWFAAARDTAIYAVRSIKRSRRSEAILMHRQIIRPPAGMIVDHIDFDGLNNQRSNLRVATSSQSVCNRRSFRGRSVFKGVLWDTQRLRWRARIVADRRAHHLGFFANEEDAARAYDRAAPALHGEFASLNFPMET